MKQLKYILPSTFFGIIGILTVISTPLFIHLQNQYYNSINIEILNDQQDITTNIISFIQRQDINTRYIGDLFTVDPYVTKSVFDSVSLDIVERFKTNATGFSKKVLHKDRPEFEKNLTLIYNETITIKESFNGTLIPSNNRSLYYSQYYHRTFSNNNRFVGFDMYSEIIRRTTINNAIERKDLQVSTPIKSPVNKNVLLFFYYPVFINNDNYGVSYSLLNIDFMFEFIFTQFNHLCNRNHYIHITSNKSDIVKVNCNENIIMIVDDFSIDKSVVTNKFNFKVASNISWIITITTVSEIKGFQSYYLIWIFYVTIIFIVLGLLISIYVITYIIRKNTKSNETQKNVFMSYVFHEIRVPFNTIGLGVDNLILKLKDNEDLNILGMISNSLNHIDKILLDVLDLYKLKNGVFNITRDYYNIYKSINESYFLFSDMASKHKLQLQCNMEPIKNINIYADRERISQVINNLISNAIKFSFENTIITINIDIINQYKINDQSHMTFKFTVTNTGIGISDVNKHKIFKPFTVIEKQSKEISNGLGLSICKSIIESHDGEISFSSEVDGETKFWFILNLETNEEDEIIHDVLEDDEVKLCNKHVLIVDDNENNCEMMRLLLSKYNNMCDVAYNGRQAIECVENNDYNLILLDNNMPLMTGIETSVIIKGIKDIKIIMISGDQNIIDKRYNTIDSYLMKPININKLNIEYNKLF